jgi:hypothetical protein
MTEDEWQGMAQASYSILAQTMEVANLQTTYQAWIGNVSPGSDVSAKGRGLDVRKAGEPIPGRDVAVLKMDGVNLPTVRLGDDAALKTGDQVYAMGYPAVATLSDALNVDQAIQEPTITQGIVSARKQMEGGWSILQTDAAIHGGNSGGPLFNAAGEVVGINTFTSLDPSTGAQVQGMNFAVPISIAMEFLNEINVSPAESGFSTDFRAAVAAYDAGDYQTALDLLHGINDTNPGFPVVQDLLADARNAADAQPSAAATDAVEGDDDEAADTAAAGGIPLVAVIAVGVVALLLAVLVVILLVRGKKSKPAAAPRAPWSVFAKAVRVPLVGTLKSDPAAARLAAQPAAVAQVIGLSGV